MLTQLASPAQREKEKAFPCPKGLKECRFCKFLLLSVCEVWPCLYLKEAGTDSTMETKADPSSVTSDQGELGQQQISEAGRKKGGLITMPFIIANEALASVASTALSPNMILYLMQSYNLGVAKATNILFLWNGGSSFMPLVGAFLADSYLGRFLSICIGSIFSLMGIILLWLTAVIPQVRPPHCSSPLPQNCKQATSGQLSVLISAFVLMSLGAAGTASSSLAFGADQFKNYNDNYQKVLESFFSWYYATSAVAVVTSFTVMVYIQDHYGWKVGFGIPAGLMILATMSFFIASPLYVKTKASRSLLTGFAQVIVVSFKNRKLPLPPQNSDDIDVYHHQKDSKLNVPTDKLRFLNKACIIKNPELDIAPDGSASDPWSLCTIEQVEELKSLIKVIPIWSTGIMMSVTHNQGSFPLLQARTMDRHVTSGFQIPPGSFVMFMIASAIIWIVLYDRVLIPLASKIRGKPVRISPKNRIGIGLAISCLSLVSSALVETVRRRKAIQEGLQNKPLALVGMSAMWLVPHHVLGGIAEAFNKIGQNEFYYSEFPETMSSISVAILGLSGGASSLVASFVLNTVNDVTSRGGKESWISDNINKGHYERYYWLLVILSAGNVLYFLVCSWAYGPGVQKGSKVSEESKEEELTELGNGVGKEKQMEGSKEIPSKEKELTESRNGVGDKKEKEGSKEIPSKEKELTESSNIVGDEKEKEGSKEISLKEKEITELRNGVGDQKEKEGSK
ncbi:protein NRT1/ PTR FAMILY 1.2-like [Quillaja saponaria]|uniref:Protein NRT1/ PTR FAMILY 1.2-like n=1 Tax=Quillaja saponaria TaxID=32244 RepID=A0AAD7PQE1_QUISA|nr:protein NRT1/ PTR FAMILY 1.2-like [Quillaja saponaria]